jgi:GNAT superfamily N-acetyltransferase
MKIIDLTPEHEKLYFLCLEDWSDEIREAGNHKECWYRSMKDKGLRVKLALDDKDKAGGMIQYVPVEHSFAEGNDLYMVLCIWVHGHKKGRGDFTKKGMGKALLQSAEDDVRSMGKKGIATWGLSLPFFMRASWFKRHGYKVADKDGIRRLLWKPFTADASAPAWIKQNKKPGKVPGKVNISTFINGWCPAMNLVHERVIRAAPEFGDKVDVNIFKTDNRELMKEWGISDALFIDGRSIRIGPPPSFEKLRRRIGKRVNKLRRISNGVI